MDKKLTAAYEHADGQKWHCRLELFDDQYLRVKTKTGRKERTYTLDVACLAPDFERQGQSAWKWLGAAMALGLVGIAFIYFLVMDQGLSLVVNAVIAVASLALASFLFMLFARSRVHRYLLFSRFAGLPLVTIPFKGKAEEQKLGSFLEQLGFSVERAEKQRGFSYEDLKSGEVRTLRRLAGEGIIAQAAYAGAKELILS